MTPGAVHPDIRRRQILVAAHRCFARSGFHETTMQDVAEEAGLSVGALYRYFPGKDGLIQELAKWGREQRRGMLAGLATGGGVEALRETLSGILGFLAAEGAARAARLDVRLWGEALGQPALAAVMQESLEGLTAPFVAFLDHEQREGRIRGDAEPAASARVLVAFLLGLELQKAFDPTLDVGACALEVKRLMDALEAQPD